MKELIQGNEAIVRASINAGCNFFAGYPITPSSEIAHRMAELLPKVGGVFIQMEDEISSINAVIGASMAGARSMTATSGPGLSLMQESIGYAAITETPVVIVDVMRAGPATGIPTFPSQGDVMSACYGSHGDYPVVVLSSSTIADSYMVTFKAFEIAEKYLVPVIVLVDEITAHMKEGVEIPAPHKPPIFHKRGFDKKEKIHVTGLIHGNDGMPIHDPELYFQIIKRLLKKIDTKELKLIEKEGDESPEILFITYGTPYRSAKEAFYELKKYGVKCAIVKLITLRPFPYEEIEKLIKGVKRIIVPEINMGQIIKEIKAVANNLCEVISVNSMGAVMEPELLIEKAIK